MFVLSEHARTLQDWLDSEKVLPSALAARVGCHRARITEVIKGHPPNEHLRKALHRETGLACYADEPKSERRPVAELPELVGTPAERLRTLEAWLEGHARGEGLTPQREKAVRTLIATLEAQRRTKPIPDLHEHPDWATTIELILDAVESVPGATQAVLGAIRKTIATSAVAA